MIRRPTVLFAAFLAAAPAAPEVVRLEVDVRGEVAAGRSYGLAGPYEKISGRIHFAVDPANPRNGNIRGLEHAPRNAADRVEFAADFHLLKPTDIRAGNGAVLLEVPNRGRKGMLARFNRDVEPSLDPETAEHFGDGFLLEQGFTLLWIGWQFDVPPRDGYMRAYVPAATGAPRPIEGLVRSDFYVTEAVFDHSLGDRGHVPYRVADPNDPRNAMTMRSSPAGPRQSVPRDDWRFARLDSGRVVPDQGSVYLRTGFAPHRIYEVLYIAADPPIAGLGLTAIRDAVAHLKHESAAALSIPAGSIDRAIAYGASQSGRLLRTFLYDGFNEDEQGGKVFDGMLIHIAGGQRGSFNHRFAQPSRSAEENFFYPTGLFPFSDAAQTDPVTGARDGLLARLSPTSVPKIFHTNSSTEYWISPGALIHASVDGVSDAPSVEHSRIYHFAGTQHGPAPFPPSPDDRLAANPNDYGWFLRALLLALDCWVTDDTSPPPSRHPRIDDGTLVSRERLRYPTLHGAAPPLEVPLAYRTDYGQRFQSEGIIGQEPPALGMPYPVLVPQVDGDGNEIGGLRAPDLAVPLATYTGWRPYDPDTGRLYVPLGVGVYVPFAYNEAERRRSNDPRASIEARYDSREHYLGLVAQEALELIGQRYVLAGDLAAILRRAGRHWDHLTSGTEQAP